MKFLKILLILIALLFVLGFIAMKMMSKELPTGQSGSAADALAIEVQSKLNKAAFDTIPYLRWEFFRPGQKYFWDKKANKAIIEWGKNKVIMQLDSQEAISFSDGVRQEGAAHEKLKAKAWSNWCNDSFWMIAPFKLFDPGTTREIVSIPDSDKQGLKITYRSGGVTPGDAYLWELDDNKRPVAWQMWTSILPVQGMGSSWTGWEEHGGAWLSTQHSIAGKAVSMKGVKTGNNWSEFGYESDPFTAL